MLGYKPFLTRPVHRRKIADRVDVQFRANPDHRAKANAGAQLLYNCDSFALLCKKLYLECVEKAPRLESIPAGLDPRMMSPEQLYYAQFLPQDQIIAEVVAAMARSMETGATVTALEISRAIDGEEQTFTPQQLVCVGRVMKMLGWPRKRVRKDGGKLQWVYVKPVHGLIEIPR